MNDFLIAFLSLTLEIFLYEPESNREIVNRKMSIFRIPLKINSLTLFILFVVLAVIERGSAGMVKARQERERERERDPRGKTHFHFIVTSWKKKYSIWM